MSNFKELNLHLSICQALENAGYTEPTVVQAQAIPVALARKDLIVCSQTGSGKTAAFMLPALHLLASHEKKEVRPEANFSRQRRNKPQAARPQILVLTPTRELALQVTTAVEKYGSHLRNIKTVSILGGMPYFKQMQLLAKDPAILVATPGRLIDHIQSGKIDLSQLQILVLDEADRMLDMGFIEDIEMIVSKTPDTRQTLLFSATLDGMIGKIASKITNNPEYIEVAATTRKSEHIQQRLHFVDDLLHKNRLLDHLLKDASINQAIVFTATKRDADQLALRLTTTGYSAAALHGDMHQRARNKTLDALRRGQISILVATDVAARGIDVPTITHVFNFDLPRFPEDYVHRIGRTGRAGRTGLAISLINNGEHLHLKRIERYIKQPIPVDVIEGFEPKKSIAPKPAGRRPMPGRKPEHRRTTSKPSNYQRTHEGARSRSSQSR